MNQNSAAATIEARIGPGLGPKNPTAGKGGRDPLPHVANGSTVDTPQNTGTEHPENIKTAVPASAIWMAKLGGTIALIAAAAISAQTLVSLGRTIGLHGKVAWLLPTSLDVYAATAIWVGYRIPAAHPASAVARRDARLALSLTVCCNVLYHLLALVGSELPKILTDPLLLCVGALPPLVVERIFHLQMAVRNGNDGPGSPAADAGPQGGSGNQAAVDTGAAAATEAAMPAATAEPIAAPATGNQAAVPPAANRGGNGKQRPKKTAGAGTAAPNWGDLALPLWEAYVDKHGEAPTAPVLVGQLRTAYPNLKVPGSPRSERNIRVATEELAAARSAAAKAAQPGHSQGEVSS